jgi:hypothetical protein
MSMSTPLDAGRRSRGRVAAAAIAGAVAGPVAVLLLLGGPVHWAVLAGLALLALPMLRDRRIAGWFVVSAVVSTIVLGGALFAWVIWAFANWKT